MPGFTPGRRWQPPFFAYKNQKAGKKLLAIVERVVKGSLFGCRMCGNCLLQETAFICPMECPKGLRNGPCGGSSAEHCYVDETRPCIWYCIYDRAYKLGREEKLLEVMPPLDWDKVGEETWGDVVRQVRNNGFINVIQGLTSRDVNKRKNTWDSIFLQVRQPTWWQGDADYHPPANDEAISELERRLKAGEFVVTAEVAPPLSVSTNILTKNIDMVKDYVAAINFTDSPSATARMSSIACSKIAYDRGVEPVMQIAARERTRIGLQAEIIGANALGIRNILCLSGDFTRMGPPPLARSDILDIDSIQMLWILRRMRDEGVYLDGRKIKYPPQLFLGAAASPYASEPKFQAIREHKKVNAGAQFFQTNLIFDTNILDEWLNELAKRNILEKVFILVGITPLKSYEMAKYIHNVVPGVFLEKSIFERMEKAGDGEEQEGVQIALELIEKIKSKQGVSGIHIMAVGWEKIIPDIIRQAKLLPTI